MNLIINYIAKMFKHSFLFTCFYIILRFIIIRRNKKINVKREVLLYVFFLFSLGLYTVAITGDFSIKNVRIEEINIIPSFELHKKNRGILLQHLVAIIV